MTEATRFGGKYLLLDTLGTGGMAEIFRGKLLGEEGFEKLIVIKKLLPSLCKNQEMVTHFINEARLAALLQHENIACIYDFGNIDNEYFIAMEYLFGKDLSSFIHKLQARQETIPPEFALSIASKVCDAMEYAHSLKDLQNNPLNIIHRDLTPHNIFITYEGKIKVIDFGIAKNELQDNETQVGVVKGKISYMSPEQLAGTALDHRSDIFSIGILLYEMLSGQKLYSGNTAELIQKAIKADYKPLAEIVPDLPASVYTIVEKTLQRKPNDRYQSCGQMQTDIDDCLHSISEHINAKNLKKFALQIFKKEFEVDNENATKVIAKTVFYSTKNKFNDSLKTDFETTEVFTSPLLKATEQVASFKKPLSNILIIPVAAMIVVIVAGLIAWQFSPTEPIEIKPPVSTLEKALAPTPVAKPPDKTNREQHITELLDKATKAYENDDLVESFNSALRYYNDVLLLDPDNIEAQKGVDRVVNILKDNVLNDINHDRFTEASSTIQQSILPFVDKPKFQELESLLQQQINKEIENLFNSAEKALNENNLTSPKDDCALKYYNDIKKLDKTNPKVHDGYMKIANRYAALADEAHKSMNLDKAKHFVAKGLEIVPDHNRLLVIKADLNRGGAVPYVKGFGKNIKGVIDEIF